MTPARLKDTLMRLPTQRAAWSRMTQAGAQMMNWFSVACELHRDWRNDIEGLGNLLSQRIPNYRNLMNGYAALAARENGVNGVSPKACPEKQAFGVCSSPHRRPSPLTLPYTAAPTLQVPFQDSHPWLSAFWSSSATPQVPASVRRWQTPTSNRQQTLTMKYASYGWASWLSTLSYITATTTFKPWSPIYSAPEQISFGPPIWRLSSRFGGEAFRP